MLYKTFPSEYHERKPEANSGRKRLHRETTMGDRAGGPGVSYQSVSASGQANQINGNVNISGCNFSSTVQLPEYPRFREYRTSRGTVGFLPTVFVFSDKSNKPKAPQETQESISDAPLGDWTKNVSYKDNTFNQNLRSTRVYNQNHNNGIIINMENGPSSFSSNAAAGAAIFGGGFVVGSNMHANPTTTQTITSTMTQSAKSKRNAGATSTLKPAVNPETTAPTRVDTTTAIPASATEAGWKLYKRTNTAGSRPEPTPWTTTERARRHSRQWKITTATLNFSGTSTFPAHMPAPQFKPGPLCKRHETLYPTAAMISGEVESNVLLVLATLMLFSIIRRGYCGRSRLNP
ncbi:hypothetical protein BJ508DRAFT_378738 [Ascobolus immersus RN42]|uniref:Uncharacterized protein n=1 Tax=Ascobolus immersus RN42 TaxID=1160509 RepID=A0A3N4HYY9_ASCIM|nr:hypothetical protein BJ508DRAFT_378738 [Ascobolus immersus RN42]